MPLVEGKYVAPDWQNGGPPAIDADELNAMSQKLEDTYTKEETLSDETYSLFTEPVFDIQIATNGLLEKSVINYENSLYATYATNIKKSEDGITWQNIFTDTQGLSYIIHSDDKFLAVGGSGSTSRIAYSSNGTSWNTTNTPISAPLSRVAYGNGVYVAITTSTNSQYVSSNNGTSWTMRNLPIIATFNDIKFGHGIFVMVGQNGANHYIYKSTNGINWEQIELSISNIQLQYVYFVNNTFILSGDMNYVVSYDGINWEIYNGVGSSFSGATYINGNYVLLLNEVSAKNGICYTRNLENLLFANIPQAVTPFCMCDFNDKAFIGGGSGVKPYSTFVTMPDIINATTPDETFRKIIYKLKFIQAMINAMT